MYSVTLHQSSDPGSHETIVQPRDRDTPGGRRVYYGWIIVALAFVALVASSPGQTHVASVFVDPIQREMGWSRTRIAGLYTLASLTAASGMFLVGWLMDRAGARVTIGAAGMVFGLAALWMSRITRPVDLFVGFALLRLLGQGALTVVPTAVVALWFVRLRGRALSLAAVGAIAGQALFPPLVHLLITRTTWRTTWVWLSLLIWVLVLPVVLLLRPAPESLGLRPDGDGSERAARQQRSARPVDEPEWTVAEALRTRAFWLLLVAASSQPLISTALTFHHMSFMSTMGVSAATAAAVFTAMAPCSLIGTLLVGALSGRFADRYLLAGGHARIVGQVVGVDSRGDRSQVDLAPAIGPKVFPGRYDQESGDEDHDADAEPAVPPEDCGYVAHGRFASVSGL